MLLKFILLIVVVKKQSKSVVIRIGRQYLKQFCQYVVVHFISPGGIEKSDIFIIQLQVLISIQFQQFILYRSTLNSFPARYEQMIHNVSNVNILCKI